MAFFQIFIPNYNSSDFIEKGLKSILDQTFKDFVIRIADDQSTDNSVELIRGTQKSVGLEKLTIDILPEKSGYPGSTRNYLIKKYGSSGATYTLFMDSDDWIHDDSCFQKIFDAAAANGLPDLVRLSFAIYQSASNQTPIVLKEETIKDICTSSFIAPWTKAIKTEKLVLFPEKTLFEDIPQHLAQCDILETSCYISHPIVVWNRQKSNTVSLTTNLGKPEYNRKWRASKFRMMADLIDLDLKNEYANKMRDSWFAVGKDWLKEDKIL